MPSGNTGVNAAEAGLKQRHDLLGFVNHVSRISARKIPIVLCSAILKKQAKRKQRRQRDILKTITDNVTDEQIFIRSKWRCRYCNKKVKRCDGVDFGALDMATIDHVKPLAKGGADTEENKVCACFECNCIRKGTKEWLLF